MLKQIVVAAIMAMSLHGAQAAQTRDLPAVVIYGPDPCLACMEWAYHLMENGFTVTFKATRDMAALKRRLGVPQQVESVLTAKIGRYFIEGHVPAEDIKQLLKESPKARGLAVPGLPLGAPGFEGGDPTCEAGCTIVDSATSERESQRELYDTLLVAPNGNTSVYARH
ncbi:MAG: DUF411 domain-containing protein [Sulfurimicrobium sp.]|nr:DUF411 domain-containing protein [Sulfurimicrobium sp.]MDP2197263.1 DUF411 domain-containing protein [Sulfurimicrobium sp.]MDP3686955.1 DUF411 domain-containing protein [Sulfurimicrobium sp.]MDZ7654782.1 DUF411 domain-containing protein [Sulfurimicrobium sp.]